jgi:hypothetical protein
LPVTLPLLLLCAEAYARPAIPPDLSYPALAPPPDWAPMPTPPAREPIRVSVRGVFEAWSDDAIGTVYRSGAPMIAASVGFGVWKGLHVEVEGAYRKMSPRGVLDPTTDDRSLQIIPMTALASWHFPIPNAPVHLFAGGGPAFVVFHETFTPGSVDAAGDLGSITGTRLGFEARGGVRFDTGWIQARSTPGLQGGIQRLEVEVAGGRRFHAPKKTNFDLSAWRAEVGLVLGF